MEEKIMSEKDNELKKVLDNIIRRKDEYINSKDEKALKQLLDETVEYLRKIDEIIEPVRKEFETYQERKERYERELKELDGLKEHLIKAAEEIKKRDIEMNNRTITILTKVNKIYDWFHSLKTEYENKGVFVLYYLLGSITFLVVLMLVVVIKILSR
jgi:K+/H+ antiporter YhaU regulatory subunit KhtT